MSLQQKAVSPDLWSLLIRLMSFQSLQDFYLAGGTALALRYGHRVSVDIDLFTDKPFDAVKLSEALVHEYDLSGLSVEENTILGVIEGIKFDCMAHQYPCIGGVECIEGVRMLAVEDIAAMKLNAIANRGSQKDFWDLYELMQHYSREQLLSFFARKYPEASIWTLEKSISYFEDADLEPTPKCLKARHWAEIKSEITQWNRL
jgi:predicted nucleotidyltransferase component of viral defense system